MAFAAVISLLHTVERLITPIAEYAYREVRSLHYTLERLDERYYRSIDTSKINALDAEIRDAVYKLEDVLQPYALNPTPLEEIVVEEILSIFTTLQSLRINYNKEFDKPLPREEDDVVSLIKNSTAVGLSVQSARLRDGIPRPKIIAHSVSTGLKKLISCRLSKEEDDVLPIDVIGPNKSITVGLSDQFKGVKDQVLDGSPGIKTIALVGMAGIGKTHLALQVFQDPVIVQKFKFRAWVRLGQKDRIGHALADIVAQIRREPINRYIEMSITKLQEILQTCLNGKRYLIVLDDMWGAKVIYTLMWWLPPSRKDSRILLTTRLEEVAKYYCDNIHHICFLDNEDSWRLLSQNVFAGSSLLSPQLEKVGRKIADKCEGLPLLILAVADILSGHEKTEEYWNKVAHNKTTTFQDAYDQISEVLSLSYDNLSQHLRVCFLYMGVFPQRSEIPLAKLVNLWTVEEFLEPKMFQFLEDFSVECVEKIVSNSLAIVCNHSSRFMIKSFRLHSAYWHLCVKEASNNKFFHVFKNLTNASSEYTVGQRRFSVQNNVLLGMKAVYDSMEAASTARSLLCTGPYHQYPVPIYFDFTLLKVLDALAIRFYDFPNQVLKLVYLRYLSLTHNGQLPSSISKLEQLEYLILRQHHNIKRVRNSTCLPKEIWDMKELRHLQIIGSRLPDPSHHTKLPNLSTLYVNEDSCTEKVFRSIPYLEKLGIVIELKPEPLETLSFFQHSQLLQNLRSLKCVIVNPQLRCQVVAPPNRLQNFPNFLTKLCLNGFGYDWRHISLICSMRYLEVLKLRCSAFQGPKWEMQHGEFQKLRYLLLEDMDLVQWIAVTNYPFPRLQSLVIRHCFKLKEIPLVIGGIQTLKTMEVIDCSPSLVASVHKMQERRNSSLQISIVSSWNLC